MANTFGSPQLSFLRAMAERLNNNQSLWENTWRITSAKRETTTLYDICKSFAWVPPKFSTFSTIRWSLTVSKTGWQLRLQMQNFQQPSGYQQLPAVTSCEFPTAGGWWIKAEDSKCCTSQPRPRLAIVGGVCIFCSVFVWDVVCGGKV